MRTLTTCISLVVVLLSGCCSFEQLPDGFEVLTINENSHRARPYCHSDKERTYLAYKWRFDDSAAYELGDRDQCDWNKLTGLSLHSFTNHKNSLMAAWRYDRDGFLWVGIYYHEDNEVYHPTASCTDPERPAEYDPGTSMRVDIGDVIETHFNVNPDEDWIALTILNISTGESLYMEKYWSQRFRKTREIYPWFGGNERAPHEITIYRQLIADE